MGPHLTLWFLPRIDEGEVRVLMAGDTCHAHPTWAHLTQRDPVPIRQVRIVMAGDTCQMLIHNPDFVTNFDYTIYFPGDPKYPKLIRKLSEDMPKLLPALGMQGEPLPLLWTCTCIAMNPDGWTADTPSPPDLTEYTVSQFNCSCVGISMFQAVSGGGKTLADVSDDDYYLAKELTNLMGVKAIEMLQAAKK